MSIFSLVFFFFWCDIHGLIMPSVQTGVNLTNEETGVYTVPAFFPFSGVNLFSKANILHVVQWYHFWRRSHSLTA